MHPRTVATLGKLEKAAWFSCVGMKDTTAANVLSSWKEAFEHCCTDDWEDLCLEASNQYCERLVERSIDRWRKWNEIVIEVKKITEPFVQQKIESVVQEYSPPPIFEHSVQWDILHVCMEAEYADVYPPGFYASQAYWYVKGHFPCGWEGQFPEGQLIIY